MEPEDLLIGRLQNYIRELQRLLDYLESREKLKDEDYSFSRVTLKNLMRNMKDSEGLSRNSGSGFLMGNWLN
jgi:hypothetical protein